MKDEFGDGWYQQMLVPTNVVEATMRIGVVAEKDHGQLQIELRDPQTGILIAMKSWPHKKLSGLHECAIEALKELFIELRGHLNPEPFPETRPD